MNNDGEEVPTQCHVYHWDAKTYYQVDDLPLPLLNNAGRDLADRGNAFKVNAEGEDGGGKRDIRADDKLCSCEGKIRNSSVVNGKWGLHMSHQTGTTMLTFPAQIMESTPAIMLATNNQREIAMVGTVPALQCQGRGVRTKAAQMKDATGSSTWSIVSSGGMSERSERNGYARPFEPKKYLQP